MELIPYTSQSFHNTTLLFRSGPYHHAMRQLADVLGSRYENCSLDSGWSVGDHGDELGRIIYDGENSTSRLWQIIFTAKV
jgi:hypothetical protein